MEDKTVTNYPGDAAPAPEGQNARTTPYAPPPDDITGTTLGNYRLVRKIAQGGMGVVYEATQIKLERQVALKILTDQLGSRPEFLQRFEREAKAAAALNHPNIVQVHDFGEIDGRHYIIMEYIEGENLATYVAEKGRLPVEEALNYVEQAAIALKDAQKKSIIHRDIKPSNLMLTRDGRVKVADLGLAKILTQQSDITVSDISIGSPHFIAPEQADDSRRVDHRADIYSLGITLLFLVTGKYAYDGNSPLSIVLAHTRKPLPSGAELGTELPPQVEALVRRMAEKDPDDRYPDYDTLLTDLQGVRQGLTPAPAPSRQRFRTSVTAVIAAVAVLGTLSAVLVLTRKAKPAPMVASTTAPVTPSPTPATVVASPAPQASEPRRGRPEGLGEPVQFGREAQLGNEPGGRPGPMPMARPPRPREDLFPEAPVDEMIANADKYAVEHPDEFLNILFAYGRIEEAAQGTPRALEVQQKRKQWQDARNKAADETIAKYKARMDEKIRTRAFNEAWNVWSDFPNGLRGRDIDNRIRALLRQSLPPDYTPPRPADGGEDGPPP